MIIVGFLGVIGTIASISIRVMSDKADTMYRINLENIDDLHTIKENLLISSLIGSGQDKRKSDEERQKWGAVIEEHGQEIRRIMADVEPRLLEGQERQMWDDFKESFEAHQAQNAQMKNLPKGDNPERRAATANLDQRNEEMYYNLEALVAANQASGLAQNEKNRAQYLTVQTAMVVIIVAGIIIALLIASYLSNHIMKSLRKGLEIATALGEGDLTYEIEEPKNLDEVGQLIKALKETQGKIKLAITQISNESQDVSSASGQLSRTIGQMGDTFAHISASTLGMVGEIQDVNAATEELTAAIEQVDSSVSQLANSSAEGSSEAVVINQRAASIKEQGQVSKESADHLIEEKMVAISEAIERGKVVNEIAVIADSISSIAVQTNLLALNASIEAARAGEHGRGFAVVADEIRTLAEQSNQYVTNIQRVVTDVSEAFNNLSRNSQDTLQFMNTNVSKDYDLLIETGINYEKDAGFMSDVFRDTAAMSQQLNAATEEISSVIQSVSSNMNSASSRSQEAERGMAETLTALEQMSAAAESQAAIAERLDELINMFKI